jgi:D-glycero-D-manno-heptose 1,7-bisphosphate phosphatase
VIRIAFTEIKKGPERPAIFIDRDGVINERRPGGYVLNWPQFVFMPGIRAALKQLASLQLPMIVISNQAAIGKGLLDAAGLEEITARMNQVLLADATKLTAAYFCPHKPGDDCICRKPKPALLLSAAEDFNIDLNHSIFIGDSETDVLAARAAGCTPVLFGTGLRNHSDSMQWTKCVPTALTGDELFEVAVKYLKVETQIRRGDRTVQ